MLDTKIIDDLSNDPAVQALGPSTAILVSQQVMKVSREVVVPKLLKEGHTVIIHLTEKGMDWLGVDISFLRIHNGSCRSYLFMGNGNIELDISIKGRGGMYFLNTDMYSHVNVVFGDNQLSIDTFIASVVLQNLGTTFNMRTVQELAMIMDMDFDEKLEDEKDKVKLSITREVKPLRDNVVKVDFSRGRE